MVWSLRRDVKRILEGTEFLEKIAENLEDNKLL
jgi:hypothetical protein